MKFEIFALVLAVAGAFAMPPASNVEVADFPNEAVPTIIVENQIRRVIQQLSQGIRNAGLDPLIIESDDVVFASETLEFEVEAFIRDLRFSGLSNIRIHSLDYNLILNRLRFDISLPLISLTVGDSGIQGSYSENEFGGQFKGSFIIESIRVSGELRVNIGVISGISLRSISINFRVDSIRSNLTLTAQGEDLSDKLNEFLNERVPKALQDNRAAINKLLEDIVKEIFDRVM